MVQWHKEEYTKLCAIVLARSRSQQANALQLYFLATVSGTN